MTAQRYIVYILRTCANTLYIGQTNNLEKRLEQHRLHSPRSAKYMRYFSSFTLVHTEKFASRNEAMKREAQLKKLPRVKKEVLICGENITVQK